MSYQVLARKWRPKTFSQLVGQESVVQALVNGLDNDRLHHAFLFTGTRGVGKTTIARILAKCLNCETGITSQPCGTCSTCVDIDDGRYQDTLEIDAASRTGVDDMRELLDSVSYAPARGRFKVYVIDEVHMLSKAAFNALLKTLEEPPEHVKFVLATTDPQKIPVTILSRCLRFNLRRLLPEQIGDYLAAILKDEDVAAEAAAIERIARAADGSMRDGLSLLDQAIAFGGGSLADAETAQMMGSIDHGHIVQLLEALGQQDATGLLGIVRELAAQSRDLETVLAELAEVLHRMGLVQVAPKYTDPDRTDWESVASLAERFSPEDVQLFYQIAIQGRRELALAPDPRTGLEMTLLRMLAFRPVTGSGSMQVPPTQSAQPKSSSADQTVGSASATAASGPKSANVKTNTPAPQTQKQVTTQTDAVAHTEAPKRLSKDADWHQLVQDLDLSGPVKELARNIELSTREGSDWQFVIPEPVQALATDNLVQKLQSALSSQLGQTVNVALATATTVSSPAVISKQAQVKQFTEAEKAISEDTTIKSLKDVFGARIIEDSVQPLQ